MSTSLVHPTPKTAPRPISTGLVRSFEIVQLALNKTTKNYTCTSVHANTGISANTHVYEFDKATMSVLARSAQRGYIRDLSIGRGDNALDYNEFMNEFDAAAEFKGKEDIKALFKRMFTEHAQRTKQTYTSFNQTDFCMVVCDSVSGQRMDITVSI